jgi:hypothetical protein
MTTPSGLLAWGQAGAYNAIDDRFALATMTGYRTGLAIPVTVVAGSGLQLTVKAGWSAVVNCGDSTSAVVGSRVDETVTGTAGPATGSRTDLIWCDVSPDNATWTLSVITSPPAGGRTGLALATLTVPAGANLASQFTITPGDPLLERRIVASWFGSDTFGHTGNTWASVGYVAKATAWAMPGRWYRVRFTAASPAATAGALAHWIGVGWQAPGSPDTGATLGRAQAVAYTALNVAQQASCDWTFQIPGNAAPVQRQYSGRMWINGSGTVVLSSNAGSPVLELTVEDMGP